jgi:N-acetylmuramoyl-L-alanine amidase
VVALCATLLGPVPRAQAAAAAPQPVVVAIDPGHGGIPSLSNPNQPFDPGAIGPNNLEEKDVALDVSRRVAALLSQDLVSVVLTRTHDVWISIADREQVAIDAHASVFVSVHCNSFSDPSDGGSLVLYPNSMGEPLAQDLSDAMGRSFAADGVPDDGIQLRDDWWVHAPMPTSTVEMAYISNPHEAALLATPDFRQLVALSIRDGIERFDPTIATQKQAILAWRASHHGAASPSASPQAQQTAIATSHSSMPAALPWAIVLAAVAGALLITRSRLLPVVDRALELLPINRRALHRMVARRRRRKLRQQSLVRSSAPAGRRSVYDDLSF